MTAAKQALLKLGYQDTLGLGPDDHLAFTNHLQVQRNYSGGQMVAVEAHWHLVHDPGYVRHIDTDMFAPVRNQPN